MRPFDWAALWQPIMPPWEVALRAAIIYPFVLFLLRVVGRKRLARSRLHDIVLLFMVSPAVRETLVTNDKSLTSAMVALATLALIDGSLSFLIRRSPAAERIIAGPVRLIVRDGQVIEDELRRARVAREELLSALRMHGRESLDEVEKAFLERSGNISFIFRERRS